MSKAFISSFMKLKQPAIPGVWGSWDPVTGSEDVPDSDWPQFDPADVPVQSSSPVMSGPGDVRGDGVGERQKADQAAKSLGQNLGGGSEMQAYVTTNMLPVSQKETNTGTSALQGQSETAGNAKEVIESSDRNPEIDEKDVLESTSTQAAIAVSYFPSQTFFPVSHKETVQSSQVDTSLEYRSPVSSPRPINTTIDVEKDLAVKSVMIEARKTYGNGPMWGVAAPPPITFNGTEDYNEVFTNEKQSSNSEGASEST